MGTIFRPAVKHLEILHIFYDFWDLGNKVPMTIKFKNNNNDRGSLLMTDNAALNNAVQLRNEKYAQCSLWIKY